MNLDTATYTSFYTGLVKVFTKIIYDLNTTKLSYVKHQLLAQ